MAEYIERAVVIETIREEVRRQIAGLGLHKLHIVDMCLVEDAVMKIPAAEVRPVVGEAWGLLFAYKKTAV